MVAQIKMEKKKSTACGKHAFVPLGHEETRPNRYKNGWIIPANAQTVKRGFVDDQEHSLSRTGQQI
jgi:hypothetical protein